MTGTSTSMEALRAFLSAVSSERQKSWNKAEANYEEVLRLMYKMKWRKHFNKEKLRLLLFECHFHCAVALQNLQNYQKALRHFRRAMEVVSWRKDECQAGCITGRVLHLHAPTLARMSYCHIHMGDLTEALKSIDRAILLDFRNPDLFCVRSLVNFLLNREEKALSDAGFAIQLSPTQVCGWLLRGLFKKIKKEGNEVKTKNFKLLEHDLEKACEVNPDAVLFIHVKDLRTHFQALFDRFLPSIRVSHSISVRDVIDTEVTAKARSGRVEWRQTFSSDAGNLSTASQKTVVLPSSPTFMCGVAKPQRRVQTCPPQDDRHTRRSLERFSTEPSISHHKYSLKISSGLTQRTVLHSRSACKSRDPNVTLRDVVSAKSACVCRDKKFIGVRDFRERDEEDHDQEHNEDLPYVSERMYSSCDFVELTDSVGQRIERFSGYKPYYNVTVHGSRTQLLRVVFTSDSSVRRKGFLAQYHITLYETMQILQQIEDQLVSPAPTVSPVTCKGRRERYGNYRIHKNW